MAKPLGFISHRHENSATAELIKTKIEATSNRQLEVFTSENISAGENWRENIEDVLRRSKYLLLVYGDPNEDWS